MSKPKKEKTKKYYRLMIKDHQQILAKMRFIINHLLDNIISDISETPVAKEANTTENTVQKPARKQPGIDPKTTLNTIGEDLQHIDIAAFSSDKKIPAEISKNIGENLSDEDQKSDAIPLKLWTEKESVADIIAKVGRITLKIIPLERELAKLDLTKIDLEELHNLTEKLEKNGTDIQEDMEIIEQYIKRYIKDNPELVRNILNENSLTGLLCRYSDEYPNPISCHSSER